ncbi:phosphoribosylaminoimidazole-succinocarboxamide synthase, chloroplastic-like [Phragmites australis]|uniref:phosphoribosylaminoimidazole-succinocarboxamide synthase, chloroplastic-like n=1 Tax=Phragmites australis TaxID=29695 RepID=UPI002D777CD4|nr:phosphoribosylaminoimidazole-succinocarboxamide synthase, chloroplastic-like [Phragmites australis]XP_062199795.1 phosphoribosylaminoimidazole-succinocarboxamide synthase, chloroplastic-like [Phragmites australis]XP_062199796.1 phosphoribosylaminoimidazole-succinocarboxamide synthase, chloroplastic-like [Phragmites australis]
MSPSAPPAAARVANPAKTFPQPLSSSAHARFPHLSMSTSSSPPRAAPLAVAGGGSGGAAPSHLAADPGHREAVLIAARAAMGNCLGETRLDLAVPGLRLAAKGKVRDVYESGEHLVLVTTDRQSAFDRVLASIPFKGQVLNETSLWWFNRTRHITPNAVVSSPDKNVTIAKRCSVFPVEFVVRGFVTGSTDTSLWTVYNKGVRNYCGNALPDGMVKNQKLSANILTPTTKAVDHDVPVTPDEIIKSGLMSKEDFDEARSKALSLFEYGQQVALQNGLILVDTKYEFGKTDDGTIMLIDEVHTPDSSRYWIGNSYEERFKSGLEPENVDKEFLRLWFKNNCNPYEDAVLPGAPEELVCELAWRYIFLFETITNTKFEIPETQEPIRERISRNVAQALQNL